MELLCEQELVAAYGGGLGSDAAAGALSGAIAGGEATWELGPVAFGGGIALGAAIGAWSAVAAPYAFGWFS